MDRDREKEMKGIEQKVKQRVREGERERAREREGKSDLSEIMFKN